MQIFLYVIQHILHFFLLNFSILWQLFSYDLRSVAALTRYILRIVVNVNAKTGICK